MKLKLVGVNKMQSNLRAVTNTIAPKSYKIALIKVMLMVDAAARPITPVKSTNLRDSVAGSQRITESSAFGAKGHMGFSANYAEPVHERITTKKGVLIKHPIGGAKFLSKAIEQVSHKVPGELKSSLQSTFFKGKAL